MAEPRDHATRLADTRARLERDVDCWVATAGADGPYLVPLSFHWYDDRVLLSTAASSPTGRNLRASRRTRLALGQTRDVVLVEGEVEVVEPGDLRQDVGDAFAARTGFDPRGLRAPYPFFRVRPLVVQAWREEDELAGRDLMRDGVWLQQPLR